MGCLFTLEVGSRQELDSRFVAQIPRIRAYAGVYFSGGYRERDRLVTEVVERVWYESVRKFERGDPILISLGITCLGVWGGYNHGDTGTLTAPQGHKRFLRGHNDSRVIQDLRAKQEHRTTRLDVKEAIAIIGQTKPMLARVLHLLVRGTDQLSICKRLHVPTRKIAEAREALRDILTADYAEA